MCSKNGVSSRIHSVGLSFPIPNLIVINLCKLYSIEIIKLDDIAISNNQGWDLAPGFLSVFLWSSLAFQTLPERNFEVWMKGFKIRMKNYTNNFNGDKQIMSFKW